MLIPEARLRRTLTKALLMMGQKRVAVRTLFKARTLAQNVMKETMPVVALYQRAVGLSLDAEDMVRAIAARRRMAKTKRLNPTQPKRTPTSSSAPSRKSTSAKRKKPSRS